MRARIVTFGRAAAVRMRIGRLLEQQLCLCYQGSGNDGAREAMPEYRIYCLDKNRLITERHELAAADDAAVIQHVRDNHADTDCEIWELGRKIAIVPCDGPTKLIDAILGPQSG